MAVPASLAMLATALSSQA